MVKTMAMRKKTVSIILFILFVTALYVFQNTVVIPTVTNIANSEFFFENTEDEAQLDGIINEKTNFALLHCHRYLSENFELGEADTFSDKDYQAWGLGGYTYVIKSHIDVPISEQGPTRKPFICTIKYTGGDDVEYANWSVSGFNYN